MSCTGVKANHPQHRRSTTGPTHFNNILRVVVAAYLPNLFRGFDAALELICGAHYFRYNLG
jgi:hypothetical protein